MQVQPVRPCAPLPSAAPPSAPEAVDTPDFVEREALVRTRPGEDPAHLAAGLGAELAERFHVPPGFSGELVRLRLPAGLATAEAVAGLGRNPRVAYAVPNHLYALEEQRLPNDLDPRLWGLRNQGGDGGTRGADIHAPAAWAVQTGSRTDGPVIAVLDTGVDYDHPDLRGNLWTNPGEIPGNGIDDEGNGVVDDVHGYDPLDGDGDPRDEHYHGTHVSGTIAAEGNNGQGVVGVNWQARLMPIRIFGKDGRTDAAAILRGVFYATRMGARITSSSWGGGSYNQAVRDAFAASPALHVMAAGNNGSDNHRRPHYPSGYDLPNSLAIAATDRNDRLGLRHRPGGRQGRRGRRPGRGGRRDGRVPRGALRIVKLLA